MTEYLAENSRLKQASRQYAKGQLSLESFRQLRREMLDALEAGQVATYSAELEASLLAAAEPEEAAPTSHEVLYKTMPPNSELASQLEALLEPEVPEVADWDSNTRILAIVLVVALLIALGTLLYVFVL